MGNTNTTSSTTVIFADWDDFCVKSLERAQECLSGGGSIEDNMTSLVVQNNSRSRIEEIIAVLEKIVSFISTFGFTLFSLVVGLFAGGTGVLAAAGIANLTNPVGWGCIAGSVVALPMLYGLYQNKATVVKVKAILLEFQPTFEDLKPWQPSREMRALFQRCVKKVITDLFEVEIVEDDRSLPLYPVCLCGETLIPRRITDCYKEYSMVICDVCDKTITEAKDIFHCPQEYNSIHRRGFDICIQCARANCENLGRYHALIIQPLPDTEMQDYKQLKKLFRRLHYQDITVLAQRDATKANVLHHLERLALCDKNDVIVICYSGHGICFGNFALDLYDEHLSDKEFMSALVTPTLFASGDKPTIAKKDILVLLNCCESGAFSVEDMDEKSMFEGDRMTREEKMKRSAVQLKRQGVPQTKIDEILKNWDRMEQAARDVREYTSLAKSITVIAACERGREANVVGLASPFYTFGIGHFVEQGNKDVTAETLFKAIQKKTPVILRNGNESLGMSLESWNQLVNKPYRKGRYADQFSLCPLVKPYDINTQ